MSNLKPLFYIIKNPAKITVLLFIFTMILFSCQKVVDVNLNSVDKEIVIEAVITDQPGSFSFKITKTANYNEENDFPAVTGATVKVTDNLGNTETFTETAPGIYTASTIQGVPGRKYILDISTNGKEYHSESTMPQVVELDTLISINDISFGDTFKYVNAIFSDPVGIENYYRFLEFHNDTLFKTIMIATDQFMDGTPITASLFDYSTELKTGDTVKVILQCIDKNVYEYFKTLSQIGGYSETASPANPTSNINNNALGYFSATATRTKTIVIQ